jgi:nucleoside-diphosphate-sugar epimerase
MRILVTGSEGFVGRNLVNELCASGHEVLGLDNLSRHGSRRGLGYESSYTFVNGDAKDHLQIESLLRDCDALVAAAGVVGGVGYAHRNSFDILAENELITIASVKAAIEARSRHHLQKVVLISSSLVYESCTDFPLKEGSETACPAPKSAYAFQKLAAETCVRAAFEQHGLPFTIVRLFNVVGPGDYVSKGDRNLDFFPGDASNHVLPELAIKVLTNQSPLQIIGDGKQTRNFTCVQDVARGIRACIEHPRALNECFNIAHERAVSILELAHYLYSVVHPSRKLQYVSTKPFPGDVRRNDPSITKAANMLGFKAGNSIETVALQVLNWLLPMYSNGFAS